MEPEVALDRTVREALSRLGDRAGTLVHPREAVRRRQEPHAARAVSAVMEAFRADGLIMEGPLGEGGWGVVHYATQASLGRQVAVKTLRPEHRHPEPTLKLLREAWITGSLEHPNILPIYDVRFDEDGQPQIVLKRIDGVTWLEVIGDEWSVKERFGEDDLFDHNMSVLLQVCRAVHFAHTRGVVHCDLKPENVMIGMHGEVYLLDWGVATVLDPEARFPQVGEEVPHVKGTPGYMAPELLLCETPSPQTDVYLLGAILFEILTGEPPHSGTTPEDVARSVLGPGPTPIDGVTPELFAIVSRAMRRRAEDRYESANAFREAIEDYLQHRNAIRLAEEAERRLEGLRAVVASEGDPNTLRSEAYELFGGCRFGFREALAVWPSYEPPQRGLEEAVRAMVELELAADHPDAASELLAELRDPPPGLQERIDTAKVDKARRQSEIDALVRLGQDRDLDRAVASRRMLVVALGLTWTIAPITTALKVDPRTQSYPSMLVAPLVVLASLIALTLWFREEISKTAINRGIVATIGLGLAAQLALAAGYRSMGLDGVQARALILLVWAIVVAMAAATIDRRLWVSALGFLIAFGVCAAFAKTVAFVLFAMGAAYFVVSLNALFIWKPQEGIDDEPTLDDEPSIDDEPTLDEPTVDGG